MADFDERDEAILIRIKRMNTDTAAFVTALLIGELTREDQTELADQLTELADMIRDRAADSHGMVIEGCVTDERSTPARALPGPARDAREAALPG